MNYNRFREVTGITEDLLNAPEYEMVMEEAAQRMAIWNVTRILSGGGSDSRSERPSGIPGRYFQTSKKIGQSNDTYDQGYRRYLF